MCSLETQVTYFFDLMMKLNNKLAAYFYSHLELGSKI